VNKQRLLATGVGLLCLLWGGSASAGGFFTPPHGVRTQGRGGAGVLSTPDMNAMWYNPAMLAGLGDFHLTVDLNLLIQDASFARAPRTLENGDTISYTEVENQARPLTIPQLGVASNLGTERLVFALGAWAPNGATALYPEQGPQRYTIIDTEGSFILTLGLAVAWRATDWLWVGAGLQNHMAQLRLVNAVTAWPGFTGDPESEDYEILFEGAVSSPWSPSANLGARAQVHPNVDVGLSVQLPVHVQDEEAQVMQRLPPGVLFDQAEVQGDSVAASFWLPWVLRTGVRYHQPRWDIELDAVIEFWSILDEISISPNDIEVQEVPGVGTIQAGALSVPRQYQDALSLRLGGDYQALPELLDLRAGVLWEQSAIPTRTLSVLQLDTDKVGLSAGLTWHASDTLAVDLSYTHLFYQDTTVRNSIVRQINPTDPDNTIVVGNGDYTFTVDMVGLGIRLDL
jgi:long-chain fatty acid transport protein